MAASYLTTAALATSAVPGLVITAAAPFTARGAGDYDSAVLRLEDRTILVVRKPTSAEISAEQQREVHALSALTAGVRTRLPFDVPDVRGVQPTKSLPAVVYRFVPGTPLEWRELDADSSLLGSTARAIAAIHSLPSGLVHTAGLEAHTAKDAQQAAGRIVDRAIDTGYVPVSLERRWRAALEDDSLWRFQPVVVHGGLNAGTILGNDVAVTGILGWGELGIGDPARDLHWILSYDAPVVREFLDQYEDALGGATDRQLAQRAQLYSELEIAKWLLHGTDTKTPSIVDDAIEMLNTLVESVHSSARQPIQHETLPVLDVDEVEELLDSRQGRAHPSGAHRADGHNEDVRHSEVRKEHPRHGAANDFDASDVPNAREDTADGEATGPIDLPRR